MPKQQKEKSAKVTSIVALRQFNKIAIEAAENELKYDIAKIKNRERFKKWEQKNKGDEGKKKTEPPLQNENTAIIDTPNGKFSSLFYYNFEINYNKQEALAKVRKRDSQYHAARGLVKELLMSAIYEDGLHGSFLIPTLPYNYLFFLLLIFKQPSSHVMNGFNGRNITGNHLGYYMYDWEDPCTKILGENRFHSNTYLTQTDILILHSFGTILKQSLSKALDNGCAKEGNKDSTGSRGFKYYPGIVKTITPAHQMLHRDDATSLDSYVLHLPLSKEGLHLRIGWFDDKSKAAKQKFIFVPFGSAILLKSDVWHGGNYGSKGNIRFHAVLGKNNWQGKEKSHMYKSIEKKGFEFDLEDHDKTGLVEASEVSKVFRTKVDNQKTKNAIKGLREAYPGNHWLNLLN